MDNNNATEVNGAVANAGAAILIADIDDTRTMMSSLSLSNISVCKPDQQYMHMLTCGFQVGTSDAGAYFNSLVLEAVDYGVRNLSCRIIVDSKD